MNFAAFINRVSKARRQLGKARKYLPPKLRGEHTAVLCSLRDLIFLVQEFATDEEILLSGRPVEPSEARADRECRVCGCTEETPCAGVAADQAGAAKMTELTCVWVAPDLCSACVVDWAHDDDDDSQPAAEGA